MYGSQYHASNYYKSNYYARHAVSVGVNNYYRGQHYQSNYYASNYHNGDGSAVSTVKGYYTSEHYQSNYYASDFYNGDGTGVILTAEEHRTYLAFHKYDQIRIEDEEIMAVIMGFLTCH